MSADGRAGVTAIVLAGGRSSRFGSDKLVAEVDGRPLLHHPIAAVAGLAAEIVIVVAPGSDPPLPAGARLIRDPLPFGGPLVGLAAALESVTEPVAIVVGGDMPSLVPAVLQRLVDRIGPDLRAVTLEVPGRVQPLPVALAVEPARTAAREVLASGGRSLRDLLAALGAVTLPAAEWHALDPAGSTIVDIDRPGDLRP